MLEAMATRLFLGHLICHALRILLLGAKILQSPVVSSIIRAHFELQSSWWLNRQGTGLKADFVRVLSLTRAIFLKSSLFENC